MNQRENNPETEQRGERGRDANGDRDFYPGSHGFEDATHRAAYAGRGVSDRALAARQAQSAPGQYERDSAASYAREQHAPLEHWNNGFERGNSQGQREPQHDYQRYDQRYDQHSGQRYAQRYDQRSDQPYDQRSEQRHDQPYSPRYDQRYSERYDQRPSAWQDHSRAGQRDQWRYRGSSSSRFPRDEFGREHSSEQLFGRDPFGREDEPRYFGTGTAGWGGPGFTGGAYTYGDGPRNQPRLQETEYSDESAVSYGRDYDRGYRRGYGGGEGGARRRYPSGPKGYQRSDERLKEDISERLMDAHYIDSSEVSVQVQGAKVVLEGVVPNRRMKHAIEDLVDACPGVQDIDNRVRVGSAAVSGASASVGASSTGTGATSSSGTGGQNGARIK